MSYNLFTHANAHTCAHYAHTQHGIAQLLHTCTHAHVHTCARMYARLHTLAHTQSLTDKVAHSLADVRALTHAHK